MNSLDVTDRDGWIKTVQLSRSLVSIGSESHNDVVLERQHGGGVSVRHVQLIFGASGPGQCRLINVGESDVLITAAGGGAEVRAVAPRSFLDLNDASTIRIGEFSLVFHADGAGQAAPVAAPVTVSAQAPAGRPAGATVASVGAPVPPVPVTSAPAPQQAAASAPAQGTAQNITLKLNMPAETLTPGKPMIGTLNIQNSGGATGVQFRIELRGLHPDCYEIGPSPILFPNASKDVSIRVVHPSSPKLVAGDREITIRVSAPLAYPEQVASISHVLTVQPVLAHTLTLTAEGK